MSIQIETKELTDSKNLLAFSAGVDSTALFFILLQHDIKFDIAIVDYNQRVQSKQEVAYAQKLATQHNIICHTTTAPSFTSHFEQNARDFRYNYFQNLIQEHNYVNLITAHQLNDQLEWLLMRLCKGAGLSELLGLQETSYRDDHKIIRPLLQHTKQQLQEYLEEHNHHYYIDESNQDTKYERNRFRADFSDPLMSSFSQGISKSFQYLHADKRELNNLFETLHKIKQLHIIKLHNTKSKSRAVDITLKKLGYLMSAAQRKEIDNNHSIVIGGEWVIETQQNIVYIAPSVETNMPKQFKDKCRIAQIPSKIRPYLFENNIPIESITDLD